MINYEEIKQVYCADIKPYDEYGYQSMDLYHKTIDFDRYVLVKKNTTLDDVGVRLVTGDISYRDGRAWAIANGVSTKDWSRMSLFAIRLQNKGLLNVPVS